MKNITDEIKKKAKEKLKAYRDERILENEILIPLYRSMGFINIESVHQQDERKHKSDLLISKNGDIGFFGVQVKCSNNSIDNHAAVVSSIYQDAKTALSYYVDDTRKSMTHYFWVTMGEITSSIGRGHIHKECPEDIKGKVTFKDIDDVIEEIIKHRPDLISGLETVNLLEKLNYFKERGDTIFAAHFAFEIFIDQVLDGEIEYAKEYLELAIGLINKQINKQIFHVKSLNKFYELWNNILDFDEVKTIIEELKITRIEGDKFERIWNDCISLLRVVNHPKIEKYLKTRNQDHLYEYNFLCDFQYIFSQLQILFYQYADAPTGLSSKQICRSLLRFGFPPIEKIEARIFRMKEELKHENNCSVDNECSLCTATVLSCLILANEDEKLILSVKGWLESLGGCRYTHLTEDSYSSDTESTEHALHYASQVLQAFIDHGDIPNSQKVLKHFFVSDTVGKDGFYIEWMKYRNNTNLETCSYILSAFLRCILTNDNKYFFDKAELLFIKKGIINLVRALEEEASDQTKVWRLYSTRENIQSLCLGLLVDASDAVSVPLTELIQGIHSRATRIRKSDNFRNPTIKQKNLMDSNVDRTTKFVEGWISYWETMFYLLNSAPAFDSSGNKLKRTTKELFEERFLSNY